MSDQSQQNPWSRYRIGTPPEGSGFNPACLSLNSVKHICHLSDAFSVIKDRCIRSSLIWDESCLRNTRTLVSWVSPNDWWHGSRYGNVSFEFEWPFLIQRKQFYWVEVMNYPSVPAYRILVTQNDYSCYADKGVLLYDPSVGDGPIFFDGTSWWWNNQNLCAEFMFDIDLSLDDCHQITFLKHHPDLCNKDGSRCEDRGIEAYSAGEEFVSNLIGRNDQSVNHLLISEDTGYFNSSVEQSLSFLLMGNPPFFRTFDNQATVKTSDEIEALTRAILLAYGSRNRLLANQLARQIQSRELFVEALHNVIEQHFGFRWRVR